MLPHWPCRASAVRWRPTPAKPATAVQQARSRSGSLHNPLTPSSSVPSSFRHYSSRYSLQSADHHEAAADTLHRDDVPPGVTVLLTGVVVVSPRSGLRPAHGDAG